MKRTLLSLFSLLTLLITLSTAHEESASFSIVQPATTGVHRRAPRPLTVHTVSSLLPASSPQPATKGVHRRAPAPRRGMHWESNMLPQQTKSVHP